MTISDIAGTPASDRLDGLAGEGDLFDALTAADLDPAAALEHLAQK